MAGCKEEEMEKAIRKGNLDRVEQVFFWWEGVGGFDSYKLLKRALKRRQTDIAMFFLKRVTEVNGDDLPCDTPLYIACKNGDVEMVTALLRRGASDMQASKSKKKKKQRKKKIYCSTPLHVSVARGHAEIVKLLLDLGADVNILDENGNTAIDLASKDAQIAGLLSCYGSSSNGKRKEKCFMVKNPEEMSELISSGVDVNSCDGHGRTAVHRAAARGDVRSVKTLLEHDSDVNIVDFEGVSPLHVAAERGCRQVVEALLGSGAEVGGTTHLGETPLHWAVRGADLGVVQLLVQSGAELEHPNVHGETPFLLAVRRSVEIVEYLLEQGAQFDLKTREGLSPLFEAVEHGQEQTVAAILRYNPSLESKNSALLAAVGSHSESMVQILVHFGADVDCKYLGGTLLHWATKNERIKTMELLLKYGADIDSKSDRNGFTALHTACEKGLIRPLSLLLEYGADANSFSKDGFIPICVIPPTKPPSEAKTILKDHIIKTAIAKTFPYLKLETVSFAGHYEWILDDTEPFEDELLLMMVGNVANSQISFYQFLTNDLPRLRKLARNKEILQALNKCELKKKFPIYHSLIAGKLRKAQRLNCLIDRGSRLLNIICFQTISTQLPEICTDEIFEHLSVNDIRNFVAAEV